ncbi:MAG: OmpA family protein [Rhizobiaceae bacterium]
MLNRARTFIAATLVAAIALPAIAAAEPVFSLRVKRDIRGTDIGIDMISADTPSSAEIQRRLENSPRFKIPGGRVTVKEFKRRPELRRLAPSIDIQSINFAFASAEVPYSQYDKVENIAIALQGMLARRPHAKVLIEGHTDAVGSFQTNQRLSERRAASLKWTLVNEFGIPARALETVGYGEEFLVVPTEYESWQNRRVTLRRFDDFVRN